MTTTEKDAQNGSEEILQRAFRLHIEAFGIEAITSGRYWDDRETLADLIYDAIDSGHPYNDMTPEDYTGEIKY